MNDPKSGCREGSTRASGLALVASIARLRRELHASPDIHVLSETNHPSFPMIPQDTMVAVIKAFLAKPPAAPER